MSQKPRDFQPKGKRGGQKFGDSPRGKGGFGDKKFRQRSEGDSGQERRFDGERPRKSFGDKPYKKREFTPRGEGRPAEDRPRKPLGEKKRFDDRPPRKDFGDKPYKKREFTPRDGDRKPFDGEKRPFERRERKPFGEKKRFDDRRPRRDFGDDRPRRDFREERAERHAPRAETVEKLKSPRPSYGTPSPAYLYGVHAVTEALKNPKRAHKRLLGTEKSLEELRALGGELLLPETILTVESEDITRLLPRDAVHQDLLLDCKPLEETFLDDIIIAANNETKVLILDQVTDPHNIGAILRSASAFGAAAVIVQTLHAPDITGVLAKAASGAVEHVPIVREVNLSRAIEKLKEAGFFCLGLDERGKETIAQARTDGKMALVLGAEGSGLRRLVAESCDALVKLPTQGAIASLNVSNAAAVALYELVRKSG